MFKLDSSSSFHYGEYENIQRFLEDLTAAQLENAKLSIDCAALRLAAQTGEWQNAHG